MEDKPKTDVLKKKRGRKPKARVSNLIQRDSIFDSLAADGQGYLEGSEEETLENSKKQLELFQILKDFQALK